MSDISIVKSLYVGQCKVHNLLTIVVVMIFYKIGPRGDR